MPPTCTPSTEIDPYQFDLDLLDADTGETLPPPTTTSDLEIEHISAFLTTIPRPLLNLASVPSGYFRGYSDEHGFRFKIETEQEGGYEGAFITVTWRGVGCAAVCASAPLEGVSQKDCVRALMMSWVLRKVITLEVKGEEEIREETWGLGEGDDGDGGD